MAISETTDPARSPQNPRWLLIALACMGIHQVQSVLAEPDELRFRATTLTIAGLTPLTLRLPPRVRGIIWIVLGLPPLFGAFVGHIIPIARDRRVPPASETAPLNLAGAALLISLGVASLRDNGPGYPSDIPSR